MKNEEVREPPSLIGKKHHDLHLKGNYDTASRPTKTPPTFVQAFMSANGRWEVRTPPRSAREEMVRSVQFSVLRMKICVPATRAPRMAPNIAYVPEGQSRSCSIGSNHTLEFTSVAEHRYVPPGRSSNPTLTAHRGRCLRVAHVCSCQNALNLLPLPSFRYADLVSGLTKLPSCRSE